MHIVADNIFYPKIVWWCDLRYRIDN